MQVLKKSQADARGVLVHKEAVVRKCFVKTVFLQISQNSQENTTSRVSFLIKLQASVLLRKALGTEASSQIDDPMHDPVHDPADVYLFTLRVIILLTPIFFLRGTINLENRITKMIWKLTIQ